MRYRIVCRSVFPLALLAGLALPASAQDGLLRAEVGLLYERFEARTQDPQFNNFGMDGFGGVLVIYANRWLAFKADVSGTWGRPSGVLASLYSYHFGAQVAYRSSPEQRWTPWGHVLGGRKRIKFDVDTPQAFSVIDHSSSLVVGGGVDYRLTKHYAWRLGELSYELTRFGGQSQHNFRLTGGLLFRW